ncbi:DUF2214 domain-containing protein [Ancylobacter polymorphus]|uniref:DUF2214 domain-containing protein n=1 Tax=Ancylobacter polymorphus TaxID=223390 RepID=A0ABU0BAD8_9HYPH|nr:DUF2214 domain-containing protein [Ancylobacter polymorphus]MDQ0302807.1 hypothetical protein [Ancylobacter polymorphus]
MEELWGTLAALADWPGARALRASWIAYLLVNAAHILGVALLLGTILVFDLRLLGAFSSVPLAVMGPLQLRVAAFGLCLAVLTGAWLISIRPTDYAANPAFQIKLALLAAALANIGLQHANPGFRRAMRGAPVTTAVRACAAASFVLWIALLVAGRWIGFA